MALCGEDTITRVMIDRIMLIKEQIEILADALVIERALLTNGVAALTGNVSANTKLCIRSC